MLGGLGPMVIFRQRPKVHSVLPNTGGPTSD